MAQLFFDSFSKRVGTVEEDIRRLGQEIAKLRSLEEKTHLSDLVLLERIQRTEGLLEQSLSWIRQLIEIVSSQRSAVQGPQVEAPLSVPALEQQLPVKPFVSPSGESGSLSAITTPTELQVLSLLAEKGPLSAPEIGRSVGRSREHTARLMKTLYEQGYVKRDQNRIPFRYSLSERVRQTFPKQALVPDSAKEAPVGQSKDQEAFAPHPV